MTHRDALIDAIEEVTATMTTDTVLEVLEAAGVPCAPIQTYDQVFADPALEARDFFWDAEHPTLGAVRQVGSPMRFSRTPCAATGRTGAGRRHRGRARRAGGDP